MADVDEKQRKRISRTVNKWAEHLGLGWWHVDLLYSADREQFKSETRGYETVAEVEGRWEYRSAVITFNMGLVAERTNAELEDDILHELVHILLLEMQDSGSDDYHKHVERTVCSLHSAFQWTREQGHVEGAREARRELKKK